MKLEIPGTPKMLPGPLEPSEFVSPPLLQPGPSRTVGAGASRLAPLPTNQCATILVPSKEVMVTSLAPAPGVQTSATATSTAADSPPMARLLTAAKLPTADHARAGRRMPSRPRTAAIILMPGRLAQLGERLVYTEEVAGSSPAPPTLRLFRLSFLPPGI